MISIDQIISIGSNLNNCFVMSQTDDLHNQPLFYVNKEFEKISGYTSSEAIGKNCNFLQGEKTDRTITQLIRHSLERKVSSCSDIINYRKNGDLFWNRLVLLPIKMQAKHFYIGMQHDVSNQYDYQFTYSQSYLEEDEQIKDTLNNILTVMVNFHLLKKLAEEEKKKKIEERIESISSYVLNLNPNV